MRRLIPTCLLVALALMGCRPNKSISELGSITPEDLQRIDAGRKQFDEKTAKYFIAIYSENSLSAGATSFYDAYQSLIKTNLGEGYRTFVISNHPRESYNSGGNVNHFQAGSRLEILRAVQQVLEQIRNETTDGPTRNKERVEVFFHLLAHGTTVDATGDGAFIVEPKLTSLPSGLSSFPAVIPFPSDNSVPNNSSIPQDSGSIPFPSNAPQNSSNGGFNRLPGNESENPDQRITWSELWSEIIYPLAKSATETIAVLGPCFSGNVLAHIPRQITSPTTDVNLLLFTSASPLTPAYARGNSPSPEGAYVTSVLTSAIVAGLRGFANDTTHASQPFRDARFENAGLRNIDTVTANELINYVRSASEFKSCALNLHGADIMQQALCSEVRNGMAGRPVDATLLPAIIGSDESHAGAELASIIAQGRSQDVWRSQFYAERFMPTKVQVFRTANRQHTLSEAYDTLLSVSSPLITQDLSHKEFHNHIAPQAVSCTQQLKQRGDAFLYLYSHLAVFQKSGRFAANFNQDYVGRLCGPNAQTTSPAQNQQVPTP